MSSDPARVQVVMSTPGPPTVAFVIRGPIARADLPGLRDRVCALLAENRPGVVRCEVDGVEPDAVTVDALARLQLAAHRYGCRVRLCRASDELLSLVAFMGLRKSSRALRRPMTSRTCEGLDEDQLPDKEGTMAANGSRMLFPNLAVKDLDRSVAFFTELGFTFDERFTDETATAMVVNEQAVVMLLTESKFRSSRRRSSPTRRRRPERSSRLRRQPRGRRRVRRQGARGRRLAGERADGDGFMYGRSFHDPDGHQWEVFWMDPAALEQPVGAGAAAALSTRRRRCCAREDPARERRRPLRRDVRRRARPGAAADCGRRDAMDWWEDGFCERLAGSPRFVVRYDHRDTGESVCYEPGAPRYTGADLVADASASSTRSGSRERTSSGCRWAEASRSTRRSSRPTASRR